jgi:hypothetical protein
MRHKRNPIRKGVFMMNSSRLALVVYSVLLFIGGMLTSLQVQALQGNAEPRTCYDSLALDTPENAVQSFVDAFQREDYPSVLLILAESTQSAIPQYVNLLKFGYLIQAECWDDVWPDIPVMAEGIGSGEHSQSLVIQVWDEIMLAAKRNSAFLIDLSGEVVILDRRFAHETEYASLAVDVIAKVEGIEGETVFRMVPSLSGRWRVLQVIVPGGDETLRPWAVPEIDRSPLTTSRR